MAAVVVVVTVVAFALTQQRAGQSLSGLQRSAALSAVLLLAVVGPLAWFFVRHQLAPLEQLRERIAAMRDQPTLALVPQHYADDEIGVLAQHFDHLMRDRLFAEARYQTSAEELRAATNSGLDAFFIFLAERNADGSILDFSVRYMNANAERMVGKSLTALSQQSLRTALAHTPVAALFERLVQVLETSTPLQDDFCVDAEAGLAGEGKRCAADARWLHHEIVPQADGVSLTLRDISSRKRDEMEIRSNRAFLQSLTDHLPMLFYAKRIRSDGIGQIVTWNHAAEATTGIGAGEILGKIDREVHLPRLAAAYEAHDRAILASPAPIDVPETRFQRRDGSVRYVHVVSVPIFDDAGRVEYIIGIGEDITERRLQQRNLQASQAELQAVSDASPLGLFRTDLAGNVTYVNRTYEVMSGHLAQEIVDDAWFRCLHPADQEAAIEGWIGAIRRHQPYQSVHRFLHPQGRIVWGSFKAVPMLIDGQVSGYVGSVDDITARRNVEQALGASEQRLRLIIDNIPALIGYVTQDQRFAFGNRKYLDAFGLVGHDLPGMTAAAVLGDDVYAQSAPYIEGVLRGTPASFERLVTHVGELRWERVSYVSDLDEEGAVRGFFSLVENITELKQAQHTFAKSEMRLRMITDNMPALIAYIDRDGRYRFCNGYYETVLGLKPEKILGRDVEEVGGEASHESVIREMARVMAGERVSFERHVVTAQIDRHFSYNYIPDIGLDGSVVGFYSMVLDITALKKVENQLRILARFDSLTGLPNRNQFEEKLAEAIARSGRSKRAMAVMFLDIDHFKRINDTLGHHGGDLVLQEFAQRLQRCVRKTDTVSRLAGDEFTIILEGLQLEGETAVVAGKIIQAMQVPFQIGENLRMVTTSIGIAVRRSEEIDPEALLRRADEALYAAKSAGRNTFESMS
ncbi:MAG: PAS domain S-box protein [Herminiimonas sp.]|nr:PAS domain S-box protein [Herminiimonas sp.]